MRTLLAAYVSAVILAALFVVTRVPHELGTHWQPVLVLLLLVLCIVGEHVTFQVHSGWSTHGGTAPHIAAALLLPPGLAGAIAGASVLVYGLRRRKSPLKSAFNTAAFTLATSAASFLAWSAGDCQVLLEPGAGGAVIAVLACLGYFFVSIPLVAGVVAIDQRRSIWRIVRGKIGVNSLVEIGLGLVGATFAALLLGAPAFAPALAIPAVLV